MSSKEPGGPLPQILGANPAPALVTDQAIFDNSDLRERAIHIHPDVAHHRLYFLDWGRGDLTA